MEVLQPQKGSLTGDLEPHGFSIQSNVRARDDDSHDSMNTVCCDVVMIFAVADRIRGAPSNTLCARNTAHGAREMMLCGVGTLVQIHE